MVAFARSRHRQHFGLATAEEYASTSNGLPISVPFTFYADTPSVQVLQYRVLHGDYGGCLGRDQHRDRRHHQRSISLWPKPSALKSELWVRSGVHCLQTQLITIFGKRFVTCGRGLTAWCRDPNVKALVVHYVVSKFVIDVAVGERDELSKY
jgi:hypothetical protein